MARITQELKSETKDNIVLAATKLFSEHGFDKTKTKAIAQICNIAEGTLFNYFPTKDDLLIAVFERMAKEEVDTPKSQLPNPIDIMISSTIAPIKTMNKIHKSLLLDLLISSVKIAKKKPKLFNRLAALDFNYIEQLQTKLDVYCTFDNQDIKSLDLAEMIYGIVATDFLMYLYDKDKTFEQFEVKVKPKIKTLLKAYIKEDMIYD